MINLSNERTNFSFNGTVNELKFDGSCTFSKGKVSDMNCSIQLVSQAVDASAGAPAPMAGDTWLGNLNFNRPTGDTAGNSNVNVSYNVKESYLSALQSAIPTLLAELEQSNS